MNSEAILELAPPAADRRIFYGDDPNQFFDLRLPARNAPHPFAIVIHGGYWRAQYDLVHAGHLCAALAAEGIATCNVEYRRVGHAGGGWPGTLDDLRAAYRWLRGSGKELGLDLNRLVIVGHSAGGHLAFCLAAAEPGIRAAVSLAGVLDLRRAWELHLSNDAVVEFLGGSPDKVPQRYREASPRELAMPHLRQKLFHGDADTSVPISISRDYAATKRACGEDVTLVEFPGAGHFELIDPGSAEWARVGTEIRQLAG